MKSILSAIVNYSKKPFIWFWSLRKRNKAIVVFILLIVLFIVFKQQQAANTKPQYITEAVQKGTIVQLVSETGNVSTGARTDVYSSSTGIVQEVFVKNNEQVNVDTPLFTVKSTAAEQEKAAAFANYLAAKTVLDTANATLYTLQAQMFAANQTFINGKGNTNDPIKDDPNYVQQNANWLAAEANYKKQQAVISQTQAALNSASLAYQATQNTIVKATAKGRIANDSLTVGDVVTAKGVTTTAVSPALVIISETSAPTINLALNEVDIPKVKEGETAQITLDAFPGKTFKGTVKSVDVVGTNTGGVITYSVLLSIDNPTAEIRPSMTANVDIEVDKAKDVLVVPNGAVKPYKGKKAVQIIDSKTKLAKFLPVTIGIKSPEETEINSGVSEGTEVIIGIKSKTTK